MSSKFNFFAFSSSKFLSVNNSAFFAVFFFCFVHLWALSLHLGHVFRGSSAVRIVLCLQLPQRRASVSEGVLRNISWGTGDIMREILRLKKLDVTEFDAL